MPFIIEIYKMTWYFESIGDVYVGDQLDWLISEEGIKERGPFFLISIILTLRDGIK